MPSALVLWVHKDRYESEIKLAPWIDRESNRKNLNFIQ